MLCPMRSRARHTSGSRPLPISNLKPGLQTLKAVDRDDDCESDDDQNPDEGHRRYDVSGRNWIWVAPGERCRNDSNQGREDEVDRCEPIVAVKVQSLLNN